MAKQQQDNLGEIIPLKKAVAMIKSGNKFPVDFDDAWQWVEYSSKQKAVEALTKNFERGTDFNLNRKVEVRMEGNREIKRTVDKYHLTVDCFKSFCMMAATEQGKKVRRYYIELEKQYFLDKAEKAKSTGTRNQLTYEWSRQGFEGKDYGVATRHLYDITFHDETIRKDAMTREQTFALELMERVEAFSLEREESYSMSVDETIHHMDDKPALLAPVMERLRIGASA
jgi:phage anti-repressor protein